MLNPYAPPKTSEAVKSQITSNMVLRWLAMLPLGYVGVIALIYSSSPSGYRYFAAALMFALAFGVFRRTHRFHLGVAILMLVIILVQAYMMMKALQHPELITVPIPARPWLGFITSTIPHGLALVSTFLLFLRRSKN